MKNYRMVAKAAALTLGALLAPLSPASAFDTGHHSDLTREALADFGFSENAIKMVQLENWLVDYYSNQPLFSGLESDLAKLHFDNLGNSAKIKNYWGNFTVNSQKAITQAAIENNPKKVLALMGMSLHAVQDFYSHSTWVETQPAAVGNAFRTKTWFDVAPDTTSFVKSGVYPNPDPIAATTDHGNYDVGLNRDSYSRPRFDEAYVYAYSGSRQWVGAIQGWVNAAKPGLWAKVQNIALSAQETTHLTRDMKAAYRLSEWANTPGHNGHWKGKGSGSLAEFAPFAVAWASSGDSIYVEHFKDQKWHQLLTNGLNGDAAPTATVPSIAPNGPLNKTAVIVRTTKIEELPVGIFESKIDTAGTADFFANITVDGQMFVETMLLDQVNPAPAWTTIKFVPNNQATVAIRYQLVDEDGKLGGADDICDINPKDNKRELDFTLTMANQSLSGDVSGVHNTDAVAVISAGKQSDRAKVRFHVAIRPL